MVLPEPLGPDNTTKRIWANSLSAEDTCRNSRRLSNWLAKSVPIEMGHTPRVGSGILLDVLQHFPNLFERGLHFDHGMGDSHVVGLGSDGVDLSEHFLAEEVEFAAG